MSQEIETYNEKENFYNSLDISDKTYFQELEENITKVANTYITELGKLLKDAQDKYSKNGYGIFGKWLDIVGISHTTAKNLVNRYEFLIEQNLSNQNLIENLPKSLSYEISKPSANPELTQRVLDGEVKTLKEFKELENELKSKNENLNKLASYVTELESKNDSLTKLADYVKDSNTKLNQEVFSLKNNPQIKEVEKVVEVVQTKTVEIIPDHLTRDLQQKSLTITNLTKAVEENENQMRRLHQEIRGLSSLKDKKEEIESKYREIDDLKIKLSKHRSEIQDMTKLFSFIEKFNQFLSSEMFPIVSILQIDNVSDKTKDDLRKIIENLQNWIFALSTNYKLN